MKKKLIIAAIIVIAISASAIKLYNNKRIVDNKIYKPEVDKAVLVNTKLVEYKEAGNMQTYSGAFEAVREIVIMPQMQGEAKAVYFKEGDFVSQGKLLVQIDDELLKAQLISAKANYDNANKNYQRYKNSASAEGISQVQIDNAYLAYKVAESQLKQLETNIEKCKVKAAFSGIISSKSVEKGAVVGMNSILGKITDISSLNLTILVPESEIVNIKQNSSVKINSNVFKDKDYYGRIEFISPSADASHNYIVKIKMANPKSEIKAGMYGSVAINNQTNGKSIFIPSSAIIGSYKNAQVYVANNGRAELRNVKIGSNMASEVQILEGLRESDEIIYSGMINLRNGSKISIVKKNVK